MASTSLSAGRRNWTFYALGAIFIAYVVFLYGPMLCIYILSFQGPQGGLAFPMRGVSLHWFRQLLGQGDTGDLMGALSRSVPLALIVMALTVLISLSAGMAFRSRFPGSGLLFYLVIASLVAPGYVLSIGIGLMFQLLGFDTNWYTSALGAQLSWTLPFGLLIMFAIFGRFSRSYEEAARDLGANQFHTAVLVLVSANVAS